MAKIVLDGITREVIVERGPQGTVVSVDGRRHDVKDIIALAGSVAFFDGSKSQVAYVSACAAGSRISLNGRTYLRTDARVDEDHPSRGATGVHDGRIEAPMPGGIIAIHVKPGDTVKAGDPVAVLESMKMHNEITAPIDGVVRRIHCKPGDQVSFGHVLAEIGAGE
jgi:biotin carboxyl carrier protein